MFLLGKIFNNSVCHNALLQVFLAIPDGQDMPQNIATEGMGQAPAGTTLKQVSSVRPCSTVLAMEVMPPSGPVKAAKMSRSQSAATV